MMRSHFGLLAVFNSRAPNTRVILETVLPAIIDMMSSVGLGRCRASATPVEIQVAYGAISTSHCLLTGSKHNEVFTVVVSVTG